MICMQAGACLLAAAVHFAPCLMLKYTDIMFLPIRSLQWSLACDCLANASQSSLSFMQESEEDLAFVNGQLEIVLNQQKLVTNLSTRTTEFHHAR